MSLLKPKFSHAKNQNQKVSRLCTYIRVWCAKLRLLQIASAESALIRSAKVKRTGNTLLSTLQHMLSDFCPLHLTACRDLIALFLIITIRPFYIINIAAVERFPRTDHGGLAAALI